MNLYQFTFDYQPHYVVANSYRDAEETITQNNYSSPKKIECLGPYVLISNAVVEEEAND